MSSEDIKEQFWVLPLPKWDRSEKALAVDTLSSKQSIHDADFAGKRVLIRVDYNVPIADGKVTDTSRIDATLDTLRYLLDPKRGKVKCLVLICHLGRPGGNFKKEEFSLEAVSKVLAGYLKDLAPVRFLPECVGPDVEAEINNCEPGTVFLLENLRFHIEETGKGITAEGKKVKADSESVERFKEALSNLGDIFVFEAFGAAHRPHASVVGINVPQRVAGLLMKTELDYFEKILHHPKRPFLAVIGGAKVTDKLPVLTNLLDLVDELVVGGGMAYTFKKVIDGVKIGSSKFDEEGAKSVKDIMAKAKERGVKVHFPTDHVIADKFSPDANTKIVSDADGIPDGWMALDVGPESCKNFAEVFARAETIVWNGPLGVFEFPAFAKGTEAGMQDMVRATRRGCVTVIGGGDTGAASHKFSFEGKSVADQVSHVSTGGGSSLVMLEGKLLPGVEALSSKADQPPEQIDLKSLWMEVRKLKNDNRELRAELRKLRETVNKQ